MPQTAVSSPASLLGLLVRDQHLKLKLSQTPKEATPGIFRQHLQKSNSKDMDKPTLRQDMKCNTHGGTPGREDVEQPSQWEAHSSAVAAAAAVAVCASGISLLHKNPIQLNNPLVLHVAKKVPRANKDAGGPVVVAWEGASKIKRVSLPGNAAGRHAHALELEQAKITDGNHAEMHDGTSTGPC